jgi:hypothetical protein
MTRTTPPRPVDIAALFPELREHARPATRLHPRPGAPAVTDSSVGGPLLWPAGEPWPICPDDTHEIRWEVLPRLPDVLRRRELLGAAWARTPSGESLRITDEERAALPAPVEAAPPKLFREPIAMIPVAQLYRRDVPGFLGPDDTDLLQVLWCPLDHEELNYSPRVHLRWRRAAQVTEVLGAPPQPPVAEDSYLPEPCVLHPEQVREYPCLDLLPPELAARIQDWDDDDTYSFELSVADGWKLGGHPDWGLTDPEPIDCRRCGTPMRLLLCAASGEWDHETFSWRPAEDAGEPRYGSLHPRSGPTGVTIARGAALWIYTCPQSWEHPHRTTVQ